MVTRVAMKAMIVPKRKLLKFAILLCIVALIGYGLSLTIVKDAYQTMFSSSRRKLSRKWEAARSRDRVSAGHGHGSDGKKRSSENDQPEIDIISEYCNSPNELTNGQEGNIPRGFILRQVHMFTRHGDRTSMHALPGYVPPKYNCKFLSWYTGDDGFIKRFPKTLDLMEGKQPRKSRFMNWALYPNKEQCSEADLTGRGALQHINLGRHLQNVYMNDHTLIDKSRPFGTQLMVKSTLLSRTYKSSVAFLYGFLPNFNISLVNIESSSSLHFCSEKATFMKSCYCQRAKTIEQQINRQKKKANADSFTAHQISEAVARIFDTNPDNLSWLVTLGDTLTPPFCHNYAKPCSQKNASKCVDSYLLGRIWDEIRNQEISRSPENKSHETKFASLILYPVLVEIAQRLRDLVEHRFTQRFIMYSGHDVTLQPLLTLLGLHDGKWPPYASRFIIETVESTETLSQYFVRLIYNGIDRTKDVLFCQLSLVNGLCPVKQFQKFVFGEMLQRYGYKSITEACDS